MQQVQTTAPLVTGAEARPLGELFSELARETGTLVRKEVELAKTELTAKASVALQEIILIFVGGVIGLVGGLALVFALVAGLGTFIPLWLSALIVGVAFGGLGVALALVGILALKALDTTPRQTIQTLKENQQWIREQVAR